MQNRLGRIFLLRTLGILAFSILTAYFAQASTVPWMTGDFASTYIDGLTFSGISPDGLLQFQMSLIPTTEDLTWNWTCDDLGLSCFGEASGLITGGMAIGDIYYSSDSGVFATFTGSIVGGSVYEWMSFGNGWISWQNYYWYDFAGTWTNGFSTIGSAYTSTSSGGNSGYYHLTTVTPEPGTLLMLGSGVLGLAGVVRGRVFLR